MNGDCIKRQDAIDAYEKASISAERLKCIPAADVQPVIHCEDCKRRGEVELLPDFPSVANYCHLFKAVTPNRFFCAYGEKRREMPSLWCEEQSIDETGEVICLAHMAEARVFGCPYASSAARLEAEYPCSDYKAKEDQT